MYAGNVRGINRRFGLMLSLVMGMCGAGVAVGAEKPLVVELWSGPAPEESGGIGEEKVRMSPRLDRKQVEVNEPEISGDPNVSFTDVEGGWPGAGNINDDPCFADRDANDFHLKSQAGRWDAKEGRWAIDEVTSPCIDAGDPMSPIGHEPFPNGGVINMGAYGGTMEASKSYFGGPPCEITVAGDINGDCIVDFRDLCLMALHWLQGR